MISAEGFFGCCGISVYYLGDNIGAQEIDLLQLEDYLYGGEDAWEYRYEGDQEGINVLIALTDEQVNNINNWCSDSEVRDKQRLRAWLKKNKFKKVGRWINKNSGAYVNLFQRLPDDADNSKLRGW